MLIMFTFRGVDRASIIIEMLSIPQIGAIMNTSKKWHPNVLTWKVTMVEHYIRMETDSCGVEDMTPTVELEPFEMV